MPYLIDGNNLMLRGQTRRGLLEELAGFAAAKKVRISVVFDGAPDISFPDNSTYKGVKVYYHARGSNADERIKRFVDNSKERQTLFVVTNDRVLSDYTRRSGAKIVDCQTFRSRMSSSVVNTNEKPQTIKSEELNKWMRYFGVDETDE